MIAASALFIASTWALEVRAGDVPVRDHLDMTRHFVKILELNRPVSTLIIGNTDIVHAVVEADTRVVLTAKETGDTNLIALDDTGSPIVDLVIDVSPTRDTQLTVHSGTGRQEYECDYKRCVPKSQDTTTTISPEAVTGSGSAPNSLLNGSISEAVRAMTP